jgi:hypothetical protein
VTLPVVLSALLLFLLIANEVVRDARGVRMRRLSRGLWIGIVPLLLIFTVLAVERTLGGT